MKVSQGRVKPTGKLIRAILVFVLLLILVLVWVFLIRGSGGDTENPEITTAPPAASQKGASTTTPGSAPASHPASSPTREWNPPRFKARRKERDHMVQVIRKLGLHDKNVLKAMAAVPRHEFVPKSRSRLAYADSPQPIGYGQTISQPYIVAEMTRQLKLDPHSRVLEVGTGSGYQAAVLTEFTPHVYTIEIIKPLADAARKRLKRLGYTVVKVRHGDGYYGWEGQQKFDAIIVTCATGQIPPPLIKQLAPGGRMVIPVGGPFSVQSLMLVTKRKDGTIGSRSLMPVRFVPFLRKDKSGG